MKLTSVLLVLAVLLVPYQTGNAGSGPNSNVVTIYADQVTSAVDIEAAINTATAQGTRPGTVILDGSKGPFILTADDKSINIFASNLNLRGKNNAIVSGCDDGLFFDDFPLGHILIEQIAFLCTGDGIDAPVAFDNVIIRNNLFQAGGSGIIIDGPSSNWTISNNIIVARDNGIWVMRGKQITISNNHLASKTTGINLQATSTIRVRNNAINADQQGVSIDKVGRENVVQRNSILGVQAAGIVLTPGVVGNRVLANKVLCDIGATCLTVSADDATSEINIIAGNRP